LDDPDPDAWTAETTGRERVRIVSETLDSPATIADVADQAETSWDTARSELEGLVDQNRVRAVERDGETTYVLDSARQFLDEIQALVESHTKERLEDDLTRYKERVEALQDEFGADSASDFREQLTDDSLSADELREIRAAVETWDAYETELRLLRHALSLYDDIQKYGRQDVNSPQAST
jgi:predicted transcriptional regulator